MPKFPTINILSPSEREPASALYHALVGTQGDLIMGSPVSLPDTFPEAWEHCLNAYVRKYSEDHPGDIKGGQLTRRILFEFFNEPVKHPLDYTQEDIERFLARPASPKTFAEQRLPVVTGFYDFARTFTAIMSGPNGCSRNESLPYPIGADGQPIIRPEPTYQQPEPPKAVPTASKNNPPKAVRTAPKVPPPSFQLACSETWDEDWRKCMSDYLRYLYSKSSSVNTLRSYGHILTEFFSRPPARQPEDFTRMDVETYIHQPCHSQRNRGGLPTAGTRNIRLNVIASFYKFANQYTVPGPNGKPKILLTTPSPTLGLYRGRRANNPKGMTENEVRRFFAVIPETTVQGVRDRCIFTLFLLLARRRREIASLKWGDIFYGSIVDEQHNQREGWLYSFTSGKGKAGERVVYELPDAAKAAIDRYLEVSGRAATITAEDPLFAAIGKGGCLIGLNQPLHDTSIVLRLKHYLALAGLSPHFSLHSLRHTSAQMRYASGADLRSISHILGHSSLSTTDIYLNCIMGNADKMSSTLSAKFADITHS